MVEGVWGRERQRSSGNSWHSRCQGHCFATTPPLAFAQPPPVPPHKHFKGGWDSGSLPYRSYLAFREGKAPLDHHTGIIDESRRVEGGGEWGKRCETSCEGQQLHMGAEHGERDEGRQTWVLCAHDSLFSLGQALTCGG